MATKIVTKNSSTASAVPTASDLVQGELAVNVADKRLFTEDNAGAIVELGTNPSGNVTFQDNGKAIFGAGSDLQIYHDGSNSRIHDAGTGVLLLQTDGTGVQIKSDGSESIADFNKNGGVNLYYDNAAKLATTSTGIDVTGTATMDGLEIATTASDTGVELTLNGNKSSNGGVGSIIFENAGDSVGMIRSNRASANDAADMLFYTQATGGANAERMRISSSGNVGIGTNAPAAGIHLTKSSSGNYLRMDDGSNCLINFSADTNSAVMQAQGTGFSSWKPIELRANYFVFKPNNTERMRIDSSGNVGIGTQIPQRPLHINGTEGVARFTSTASGNSGLEVGVGTASQAFVWHTENAHMEFATNNIERMRIASSGRVGIGEQTPLGLLHLRNDGDTADLILQVSGGSGRRYAIQSRTDGSLATYDSNAGTERMRIDSSGNVGIGNTVASSMNAGANQLVVGSGSTGQGITLYSSTSTAGSIHFADGTSGSEAYRGQLVYNHNGDYMAMLTAATERMRIDSSGNLLVGSSSFSFGGSSDCVQISGTEGRINIENDTTSTAYVAAFYNTNGLVGRISTSGSATSYVTSSDKRLKKNIADADDAGSKVDAIQVRKFDWKADGSHQDYGMIAQELQTVAPEAVSGDADSEEMMGVDYSKLVPMLIKEIQSLRNRVAQLEE